MKRVLITGGAGFLGHHVVEHIIKNTNWEIVVLDKLTYASKGLDRLRDISCFDEDRVLILTADFSIDISEGIQKEIGEVDYILHIGAETHVDRSIENPLPFVMSNVLGTMYVLELAKKMKNLKWFNMFSTDEVYGPAPYGKNFLETDRHNPTNPYSATKSAAEQLALAYQNTYKIPVFITNTMNIFGERQHYEKFIPLCIRKILQDEVIYIHSNPDKTKAASRFWVHSRNVASALLFLLENAENREAYNIVGEREIDCVEIVEIISCIIGKRARTEMVDFHSSRPGHDLRYALDGTKLKDMGWRPPMSFEDSIEKTVNWSLYHPQWLGVENVIHI